MRRLVLFRHAKAEAHAAGGRDFDRGLTKRGRRDAELMGKVIVQEGFAPDVALVSSAKRARQTWQAAATAMPSAACELHPDLYNASPEEIATAVRSAARSAGTVMVIGHNPGLQELAVNLLVEGGAEEDIERVSQKFATASVAVFGIASDGKASLCGLYHARDHGGDGE
ncbi:MAG TPA: histidine phosphatase family protein [Caulobacteraceae bacterium]|nr:histidine phosphatase family protein [Caulobacteraceae bacterium]